MDIEISKSQISGSVKAVQELCQDTLCTIEDPENIGRKLNIPCSGPSIYYYQYQQKLRERDKDNTAFTLSLCGLLMAMIVTCLVVKYV